MNVPKEFQPKIKVEYPKHNIEIFEQWCIRIGMPDSNRIYLPINWCAYQVNNKYGKDKAAMDRLQRFVNTLDSIPMYSITQYDDSILVDISHLDILIFGSGGGRIDCPIPLVCMPHGRQDNNRDIFASFIGSLTHMVRREMLRSVDRLTGYYVSTEHHKIDQFCNMLSRSVFALCPRGYGKSSFRICEALEQGAIPVYISDEFIFPEGQKAFEEYGVVIDRKDIQNIKGILESITPEQIKYKQEAGKIAYRDLYTYEGCRNFIKQNL